MGNCVLKGLGVGRAEEIVKVVSCNGGMMELYAPITAEFITDQFPGHAIFCGSDVLLHKDELLPGQLYHLLPINTQHKQSPGGGYTPYRMSLDKQRQRHMHRHRPEVFPRYSSRGVWKVKLVITPDQLSQILAEDDRTHELIESVRTVAKCTNAPNSDQSSATTTSSFKSSFHQYATCHVD